MNNSAETDFAENPHSDGVQQEVSFERARNDYCKRLFDQEVSRKDMNERKAQLYLTIVTVFLGTVLLKIDSYKETLNIVVNQNKIMTEVFVAALLCFFIFTLFSLFSILQALRLRKWEGGHPAHTLSALFSPGSKFVGTRDERDLLRECALEYVLAWETNHQVNDEKAKWIQIAFYCLLFAIVSIFVFLFLLAYVLVP